MESQVDSRWSSETLAWAVEANDVTSGVAPVVTELDGDAVEAGDLDLWNLELGEHRLVLTVTDAAGNEQTKTVTYIVTTSVADLRAHVERLAQEGAISAKEKAALMAFLAQAERHLAADRPGSRSRLSSGSSARPTRRCSSATPRQ